MILRDDIHASVCDCQRCQVKRASLQELLTFIDRGSPAVLDLVQAWKPDEHVD